MKYRYDGQKTSLVVYKEALISYSGKAKKAEDKTPDLIVILTEPSKMIECSTEAVCDNKVRVFCFGQPGNLIHGMRMYGGCS